MIHGVTANTSAFGADIRGSNPCESTINIFKPLNNAYLENTFIV